MILEMINDTYRGLRDVDYYNCGGEYVPNIKTCPVCEANNYDDNEQHKCNKCFDEGRELIC